MVEPQDQIKIQEQSMKSLFLQMRFNNQPIAYCTGFVAESRLGHVLVTNLHNVTGRNPFTGQPLSPTGATPDNLQILHNRSGHVGHWISRVEPLFENDTPRWFEHPILGSKADFVALPLNELDEVQIRPYSLGEHDPPILISPADNVSVVGFPFGLRSGGSLAIWATGFVATEPQIDHDGLPIFLIDCRARQGQSGSPVIAHRSGGMVVLEDGNSAMYSGSVTRFLGIYSGRINKESDLGIVWKVRAIRELIDSL